MRNIDLLDHELSLRPPVDASGFREVMSALVRGIGRADKATYLATGRKTVRSNDRVPPLPLGSYFIGGRCHLDEGVAWVPIEGLWLTEFYIFYPKIAAEVLRGIEVEILSDVLSDHISPKQRSLDKIHGNERGMKRRVWINHFYVTRNTGEQAAVAEEGRRRVEAVYERYGGVYVDTDRVFTRSRPPDGLDWDVYPVDLFVGVGLKRYFLRIGGVDKIRGHFGKEMAEKIRSIVAEYDLIF